MLRRRFFSKKVQKHTRRLHHMNGHINECLDADCQRIHWDSDTIYITMEDTGLDGEVKQLNKRIHGIDSRPL